MHGAKRVVTFCLLTAVLPTILLIIPLYLRHSVFADVTFAVAESDVVEIVDGMSSVFCQAQSLKMNSSFHAFQMSSMPEKSERRKHIHLKKSMILPDDTLEYWGFFLPQGSTVVLSACSRYPGSHILVVKGEKNLQTCGLMDRIERQGPIHMAMNHGQVRITLETRAEVINDDHKTIAQNSDKTTGAAELLEKNGMPKLGKKLEASAAVKQNEDKDTVEYVVDDNTASEDESDSYSDELGKDLPGLEKFVAQHLEKHHLLSNDTDLKKRNFLDPQRKRHAKRRGEGLILKNIGTGVNMTDGNSSRTKTRKSLEKLFNTDDGEKRFERQKRKKSRDRRNVNPGHVLDAGIGHGGNAAVANVTNIPPEQIEESDASSFENDLLSCYGGQILLINPFPSSTNCTGQHVLENNYRTMKTIHDVLSDGYYYYIFYSDNDYVQNDVHATFDIHKPTYQYTNFTNGCVNQTECAFPISFMSNEVVIVEVPTRDGIEHEEDDITLLISSCEPRMSVYVIFPIAVLFLILGCAFL